MPVFVDFRVGTFPARARPLSDYKFYKGIPANDVLKTGQVSTPIYRWNCQTQRGIPAQLPARIPIRPTFTVRNFTARNQRTKELLEKEMLLDLILTVGKLPADILSELAKTFPTATIAPKWAELVDPHKPDHSFTVYLDESRMPIGIQFRHPKLRNYVFILQVPVCATIRVHFTGQCNGARPLRDRSEPFNLDLKEGTADMLDQILREAMRKGWKPLGNGDKILLHSEISNITEEDMVLRDDVDEEIDFEAIPGFTELLDPSEFRITYDPPDAFDDEGGITLTPFDPNPGSQN